MEKHIILVLDTKNFSEFGTGTINYGIFMPKYRFYSPAFMDSVA